MDWVENVEGKVFGRRVKNRKEGIKREGGKKKEKTSRGKLFIAVAPLCRCIQVPLPPRCAGISPRAAIVNRFFQFGSLDLLRSAVQNIFDSCVVFPILFL